MKHTIAFLIGLTLLFLSTAHAQKSSIFNSADGAINGYDPVAYFTENKAVKGDKQYKYEWNASTWYFSSQQNMNTFKASPDRYIPQYGGYCAYGLANGHKAPTDPQAWLITDGKLYLNYNKNVQQKWKEKREENIKVADELWPALKDKE